MRPRKDVLLWGPVEDEVRRIAYIVELRLVARVYVARTLEEMMATASCVDFFAVVLVHASDAEMAWVQRDARVPVVALPKHGVMVDFLERLKIALVRKRGPKKALHAAEKIACASVGVDSHEDARVA